MRPSAWHDSCTSDRVKLRVFNTMHGLERLSRYVSCYQKGQAVTIWKQQTARAAAEESQGLV